jgi:tryptophan halogenase
MFKEIVVVGGGTAGWLTALFLHEKFKNYNDINITVIESSDIGILGAGEGTTPSFVEFLEFINIDPNLIIKKARGTIKQGIKFTNWHGDNTSYFHPFNEGKFTPTPLVTDLAKGYDDNLDNICLSFHASEANKLKFKQNNNTMTIEGNFALHFDARALADLLKEIGTQRGIKLIDDIVESFKQDNLGNITAINLKSQKSKECDFVFDCSGFSRLIIGKLYQSEWISSSNILPADKAFPFFLPPDDDFIPPYTEAIAMSSGWVWKIPVQGRYGCGYVYDSTYLTDEQAKQEIINNFKNATFPREIPFKFSAGYYKDTWVNNCVALGLSSGFFEPLEATSIWNTVQSLVFLTESCLLGIINNDKSYKDYYNDVCNTNNKMTENFLQLHYLTDRNDSEFWRQFRIKNEIHKEFIELNKINIPKKFDTEAKDLYKHFVPMWVLGGLKLNRNSSVRQYLEVSNISEIEKNNFTTTLKSYIDTHAISHLSYINSICN